MTPEERIRAAVVDAVAAADTSGADNNELTVITTLVITAQTAAACALLAELRAPREGEADDAAFDKWWRTSDICLDWQKRNDWEIARAGWDAHAAASKARTT